MVSSLYAIAVQCEVPRLPTRDISARSRAMAPVLVSGLAAFCAFIFIALAIGGMLPRRQLAFVSNRDDNPEIYLLDVDHAIAHNFTHTPAADLHPAWSPDGQRLAFLSNRNSTKLTLYLVNADGSGLRQVTTYGVPRDYPLAWSPDSREIAFVSASKIYVVNSQNGILRRLTNSESAHPAWSPDGQHITFVSMRDGNAEIYVMDADGSHVQRLTHNIYPDYNPIWSSDGSEITFLSVQNGGSSEIYAINRDGSSLRRLTRNYADDRDLAWSPDGRRLAFVSWFGSSADIVTVSADGAEVHPLTHDYAPDFSPAWSPDGQWIALRSVHEGTGSIYVVRTDCERCDLRRLTYDSTNDWSPVWRP